MTIYANAPQLPWESATHIALKAINAEPEEWASRRKRDVPFTAPIPVDYLPAWKDEISQVYTTTNKSFAHDPKKVFSEYFPKAPSLVETPFLLDPRNLRTAPRRTLKTTAYREGFMDPPTQGIRDDPQVLMSLGNRPMTDGALNKSVDYTDHFRTTYDSKYLPMDMKHYSQHLLRMKTTSPLTTGGRGGYPCTGNHVLTVSAEEVEQGLGPGDQYVALRNPAGGRELLEVRSR
eukprot:CAMPEP_0113688902 /NCGR_PEP_ID=MMETSP0038_2-20120614/16822_1 /TAXON_ID=2898 /ORGANISM="Cryptomonas paramecium" /LENGTH=232 /DNA_ID=CAMNT_0000609825 /DNA_START=10 /DNA_END=704 /DNA_ORIENTATION=+ /assembly_acc=CAM_ASM_000170